MSVFKRATYSKSSGRSWSISFPEMSRFLCLPWNQKWELSISRKCQEDPQLYQLLYQPAFFFLKELFCHVHTDGYRWKSFWGGTPMRKATEILFFSSWGTKVACLELFICILAYLSNLQYSGRWSSYQNWSLDCNARGSLKYCWSCCLGNSVLEILLCHYSCWTKLLWKL